MAGPLSSYCGNPGDQSDSLKLPAIRSLTDLHGPCPTPSLSAATSPPRRPLPWPLHEDTRSKAAAPSLDSSSGRFTSGTPSSSSSSSARSGQNITHLSRPLLQPPASIPAGAPASASQPHPFFDRGRKSSLYVSPPREAAMQSQDDREASAGREHSDDALSEAEEALRLALSIVSQAKELGISITPEAVEEACRETSRASSVLQAFSAKNRIRTRALLRSRGQRSAPGDDGSSTDASAVRSVRADSSAPSAEPLRRDTTATSDPARPTRTSPSDWTPASVVTEVQRPSREVRAVYEGFDPESEDLQPRPPTTVVRTQTAPMDGCSLTNSHVSPPHSGVEAEASYMYAPPSIRHRLANLHKEQQRVLPPILPSQPLQQLHPHEWDRSTYRHGPALAPISHSESRWGSVPSSSATQGWPPGPIETSHDPRSIGTMISPDRQHSNWSDGQGVGDSYSGENEGGMSKYKKRSRAPAPSACRSCGTSETPEWRRGPDGARTLCNACGLHFAKVAKRKSSTGEEPLDDDTTAALGRPRPPLYRSAGSS